MIDMALFHHLASYITLFMSLHALEFSIYFDYRVFSGWQPTMVTSRMGRETTHWSLNARGWLTAGRIMLASTSVLTNSPRSAAGTTSIYTMETLSSLPLWRHIGECDMSQELKFIYLILACGSCMLYMAKLFLSLAILKVEQLKCCPAAYQLI